MKLIGSKKYAKNIIVYHALPLLNFMIDISLFSRIFILPNIIFLIELNVLISCKNHADNHKFRMHIKTGVIFKVPNRPLKLCKKEILSLKRTSKSGK